MKCSPFICILLAVVSAPAFAQTNPSAAKLAALINRYRADNGLPPVAISRALARVAELHVSDLETRQRAPECGMHSWSNAGPWSPCCYTPDHAKAQCMWLKPAEITQGAYAAQGYEVTYRTTGRASPEDALRTWKASANHRDVIINKGAWGDMQWRAMGVAIGKRHAVVWFGEQLDPVDSRTDSTTKPNGH